MARQIKNKSCYEQVEKRNVTSRISLFGIVKNIFKLNHTKPAANIPSYITARKAENSEVIAIQAQAEAAQAQFRRLQMIQ